MRQDRPSDAGLDYAPCHYGTSRLTFRGPPAETDGGHLAFLGGSATFGKGVARPFPVLIGERLGLPCVNLGIANASLDALTQDATLCGIAASARFRILQITGAEALSNRFYTVHPRRNDRFIRASDLLVALYPEVDFSEICFVRHLLATLWHHSPDRFALLVKEVQAAWLARMRRFLADLGPETLLLWFATKPPSDEPWEDRPDVVSADPLFVTHSMVAALLPLVWDLVVVTSADITGLPGPAAHEKAAKQIGHALGAMPDLAAPLPLWGQCG